MEQSKEFLVDMLGHITGINAIVMASLHESPEILEETPSMKRAKTENFRW